MYINNINLTLGSLFDGIGGFPYAASFFGIKTLWASEILPQAISVTKRRLPDMVHVGDITALSGYTLPPVDIITFGSPCQDLSVAGKREGLSGQQSGLFSEAVRIIDEMRCKTNGKYPRYALWENVPGALSSGARLDFKAVLEAFTKTEVSIPPSGRWANAGMVRSGGIDLAWCVYNAQYFGVPQRRRRIFLIVDFSGGSAGEILFVPKSLQGYFAAGGTPRQGPAAYAFGGADCHCGVEVLNDQGGSSLTIEKQERSPTLRSQTHGNLPVVCTENKGKRGALNCLNAWDARQARVHTVDGVAPTLAGADGGGSRNSGGLVCAAFLGGAGAKARSIGYSEAVSPTLKSGACGFLAPCLCHALPEQVQTPCGESDILCAATAQASVEIIKDKSATLTCYQEQPIICKAADTYPQTSGTLRVSAASYHEQPVICKAVGVHQNQSGDVNTSKTAYTLSTSSNATARNAPLIAHPKVSGTLCASAAGLNRPERMASETDLCIVIPHETIPIHDKATRYNGGGNTRKNDGCGNGLGIGKDGDPFPTLTSGDRHAVATVNAVDCRNLRETPELSGTLQSKATGGYSLNYQNPIRANYIVRRLMPVECERLQGFPDGWTTFDADGNLISDTARYMMLGNSIAVPCAAYIFTGIMEQTKKERDS